MTPWMLLTVLAAATLALPASPGAARGIREAGDWTPSAAQLGELEARLPQEPPAGLLNSARFYYGLTSKGRRYIVGEILSGSIRRTPGIHLGRDLPIVMDGGCGVINLTYDVAARRFVGFACNGQA